MPKLKPDFALGHLGSGRPQLHMTVLRVVSVRDWAWGGGLKCKQAPRWRGGGLWIKH